MMLSLKSRRFILEPDHFIKRKRCPVGIVNEGSAELCCLENNQQTIGWLFQLKKELIAGVMIYDLFSMF